MALMTKVGLEFIARNRANTQINSFNRSIKRMGRQMLAIAGVGGGLYAFTRGFGSMIKAASSAEETQAKFNTVFKNLSDQANAWAESFGKSVGRSERDIKSWMARLQDTFVPLGISRDEALKLAQSLTTLAVDVASFNDAADADVIRDFTSALVGNHETVRKFGIIISETALKQEAMRRGINKTYKELTDLEKVQLRYNLILAGTSDAQGDALRTSGSYANQVKRLLANVDNLKVSMGEEFLPVLTDFVKLINENEEALVAFSKAILAPVTSLLYLIDIIKTLQEAQGELGPVPYWGFGPSGLTLGIMGEEEKQAAARKRIEAQRDKDRRADERYLQEQAKREQLIAGGYLYPLYKPPDVIKFEEPEWLKNTLALNVMTEAQKRAQVSMYEMSMKAKGLGDELAKEQQITQFAALAKERYGVDVAGARAAVERFTEALKESETAAITAKEIKTREKAIENARQMISALEHEYEIRGLIDEERERSVEMARFEAEAIIAYGEGTRAATAAMEEYRAALNKLIEGRRDFSAFQHELGNWAREATNFWRNLGQVTTGALDGMADTMTTALLKGEDVWKSFAQTVVFELTRMIIKMQMAQALMWAFPGLFPAPTTAPTPTRYSAGAGTMYQTGGYVQRGGLAKLHTGETILPASPPSGIGGGKMEISIHNEGSEKLEISSVEEYMFGDQRIIDVTLQAMQHNMGYQSAIKSATRS